MLSQPMAPLQMLRGRVICTFEGLNSYQVELERSGWVMATYKGASRGGWGASESGGFVAGQVVWVGVDTTGGSIGAPAVIFGACAVPNRDWAGDHAPTVTVGHPDQVGYRHGKRFAGRLRAEQLTLAAGQNAEDLDPVDALPGDWMMTTPQGNGVGVEGFRTWIRGGHMSQVVCHAEDQSTDVIGLTLRTQTLLAENEDSFEGASGLLIERRYLYPSEAFSDQVPRVLHLEGPLQGGAQTTRTGVGDLSGNYSAVGLLREHRGVDGSLVIQSAHSIRLVRTLAIPVATENRAIQTEVAASYVDPPGLTPDEVSARLAAPRPYLVQTPADPKAAADSVERGGETRPGQLPTLSYLEQLQNLVWRVRQGTDGSPRWTYRAPPAVTSLDGSSVVPLGATAYRQFQRGIWQAPVLYNLPFDALLPWAKVALGTSGIFLEPDGSVIIRASDGTQLTLGGGTITVSAANDIQLISGRNIMALAGQYLTCRADQDVEIAANQGRVGIKAETQLGLLGGNSGEGGILLDNRSTRVGFTQGTGTDQIHHGLTILSRGGLSCIAPSMYFDARTSNTPSVPETGVVSFLSGRFNWQTPATAAALADDFLIRFNANNSSDSSIGQTVQFASQMAVLPPLYVTSYCVELAPDNQHIQAAAAAGAALMSSQSDLTTAQGGLTVSSTGMGFTWGVSTQYRAATTDQFFLLEQPWQRQYRSTGAPPATYWVENPVITSSTKYASWPGYDAWAVSTRLVTLPWGDWLDPTTDQYASSLTTKGVNGVAVVLENRLPITVPRTCSGNLIIRPSL